MLLKKDRINELLAELSKKARVYVPTGEAKSCFAPVGQAKEPAWELINTLMPPKDLLFPQTQKMYLYGFDEEGNAFVDASHDADAAILFGVRSCDMRSIECLDDVFLTKGYGDELYGSRRKKLITVARGCARVAPSCFCDSMGLDPNNAPAADIQLNETTNGSAYVVSAHTKKGAIILNTWRPFLEEGEAETVHTSCELKINTVGLKDTFEASFEHPLWEDLAKKCLTCGTCTYVCPTCHCFDISQENRMKEGERFRCWDSCMFTNYTEMAGHHNPRADKVSRVRQRFMHKLCFFEDRYGKALCVGCGRCIEKCPVAFDITSLIEDIQESVPAKGAQGAPGAPSAPGSPSAPAVQGAPDAPGIPGEEA